MYHYHSFSISCNGGLFGFFEGERGIRQGDPISLLIFVLVMEYFSRLTGLVGDLPDFRYHPM